MKNLGAIQETVLSEGWFAIKQQIEARMNLALLNLAKFGRSDAPSDDALRGLISDCQWMLDFEKRVTRATQEVVASKEQQATEDVGIGSPMTPDPDTITP